MIDMNMMNEKIFERVLRTVRHYDMLKPGDRVLAAVSGGPDSVFLLHALNRLKSKLKIAKLAVCNLDHGLRPKASASDSSFVKDLARSLGLDCFHKKVKLAKTARNGLSTEEIAREVRYKFYVEAAGKMDANIVATGHTLDDHAETVIMRIVKGSSAKGIIGISPARKEGRLLIVRPLIEMEKSEVVKFLDDNGIGYKIDHTNLEPIYFRNVVRGQIMPFLEKYNPRIKNALFSLSEHLREDYEFIEQARLQAKNGIALSDHGVVELKLSDVAVQPRVIQKEILRDSLEKAGGEVKKLSFRHWKEVEDLIRRKGKGFSLDLPGGIRVTRTEKTLVFKRLD